MKYVLLLFSILFLKQTYTQNVDILISSPLAGYPETTVVTNSYINAGFTNVNITEQIVDNTLNILNYDVAIIVEHYTTNGTLFLTNTQRQIVETFIQDGGHVVWVAENRDTYFNGTVAPSNNNAITTINNLFGVNIQYGTFFNNGGMGSPDLPRIHPSSGPGGLSVMNNLLSSGSYATLLNTPALNAVYTSDSYDNTNFFNACTHTTVALFPENPITTNGTVIISTEIVIPFTGQDPTGGMIFPPVIVYNTQFDNSIATLHYNLITNTSMSGINNWSNTFSNTSCITLEAIFGLSSDNICEGDSIIFIDESTGGVTSWDWTFNGGNITNSNSSDTQTITFNNPGTYNIVLEVSNGIITDDTTISITVSPSISIVETHTNPSCYNLDGQINLSGFNTNTEYEVSYIKNGNTMLSNYISNNLGEIQITNLDTGIYYQFNITEKENNNLVLNSGFDSVNCQTNTIFLFGCEVDNAYGWSAPNTASSDSYHSCHTGGFASNYTPFNFSGFQTPLNGNGYAGIITFEDISPNYREYVQTSLSSPLQVGEEYTVGFYCSLADKSKKTSNGLGMFIGTGNVNVTNSSVLNYTPQLVAPAISDTANWTLIQNQFTAVGGENNIIIGNFNNALNTIVTTFNSSATFDRSYYYIDSVFVVKSVQQCFDISFDSVILEYPTLSIDAGISDTVCFGSSISLTAINPLLANLSWSNNINDGTLFTPENSLYYVVTADLNGCLAKDSVYIHVNPSYIDTANVFICNGETYLLPNGVFVNSEGYYSNLFQSEHSCDSILVTHLTLNKKGVYDLLKDTVVCNTENMSIKLNSTNIINYEWFLESVSNSLVNNNNFEGANTEVLSFSTVSLNLDTNNLILIIEDECNIKDTMKMELVINNPSIKQNLFEDTTLCDNDINLLTVDYQGKDFIWNTGQIGRSIQPVVSGMYILSFVDIETNCIMNDTINVAIKNCVNDCSISLPTAFSPNKNNINDKFRLFTNCKNKLTSFELRIYNRWGEMIYFSDNQNFKWDGTYKNMDLLPGAYIYNIQYQGSDLKLKRIQNSVTIIK